MPVNVRRIGADTRDDVADDLSGGGASKTGGRWNQPGERITYASFSIALAALETLAHLGAQGLPLNRFLVAIEIPDAIRARRIVWRPEDLPVGWTAVPEGSVCVELGSKWLADASSALLCVPSVVVPEEHNVMINPRHPDAAVIGARKTRPWLYDGSLCGG